MNLMGNVIAQKLHEVVQEGELGLDYGFDRNREKNRLLRRNYVITDEKII